MVLSWVSTVPMLSVSQAIPIARERIVAVGQ